MILKVFMEADANENGTIEREELKTIMNAISADTWSDEQLDTMFAETDTDEDGSVDYGEWVAWVFEDKELTVQMLGEEYANEVKAKAYKPASGETLYVPESKAKARLLLREDQTFSYVSSFSARFSEGVQGTYSREGQQITVSPTHFGEFSDIGNAEEPSLVFTLTLGDQPLTGKNEGCFSMTVPEDVENCWLDC